MKIIVIVLSLFLFSCEERVEPKQNWIIKPNCPAGQVYYRENEEMIYFNMTETEVKVRVEQLRAAGRVYNITCGFNDKVKKS